MQLRRRPLSSSSSSFSSSSKPFMDNADMSNQVDDFDKTLEKIGGFGRYQRIQFVILAVNSAYSAFHMLSLVFTGATPNFRCDGLPENSKIDPCSQSCKTYLYEKDFTSIVTEWDLVCQQGAKVSWAQSAFMGGVLVGVTLVGKLADTWGRKNSFFLFTLLLLICATASGMVHSYTHFLMLRFLSGLFTGGMGLSGYVLSTEAIGSSYRALAGTLMVVAFSLGIMAYSLLAYFIRSWRMLTAASTLPGIAFLLFFWYISESPRWLLSRGRVQEAEEILVGMARANRVPLSQAQIRLDKSSDVKPSSTSIGILDGLQRSGQLRTRMTILMFDWFTCSLVYYGLTMTSGNLGSNIYVSLMLSGLVELPAYQLSLPLLNRFGRRPTFCGSLLLGAGGCLSLLLLPPHPPAGLQVALALTGKLGIASAFNIVYIYSSELLPTVIRNTGLGVCSMAARIGGISAPLITPMGNRMVNLTFGGAGLIAGMASLWLPETLGKPLPATIEELV